MLMLVIEIEKIEHEYEHETVSENSMKSCPIYALFPTTPRP
jgi:hypothetical protein